MHENGMSGKRKQCIPINDKWITRNLACLIDTTKHHLILEHPGHSTKGVVIVQQLCEQVNSAIFYRFMFKYYYVIYIWIASFVFLLRKMDDIGKIK